MTKYRTFDEYKENYFRTHPEEIDEFITIIFEEYAKDHDTGALLASLRIISRIKGITVIAEKAGITRNGLQKALSEDGNPKFENITSIMQAIGYNLMPYKSDMANPHISPHIS